MSARDALFAFADRARAAATQVRTSANDLDRMACLADHYAAMREDGEAEAGLAILMAAVPGGFPS